jgi:tripartite-type tricarboxylate transporter receptor subunit TctC
MTQRRQLRSAFGLAHIGAMVALALTLQVTAGAAQSVSDTFRGKTLRILLPTLPGGGRSLYALPFAQFFGKHIPGNPTILPVFMPGAGGSIAVNNAYGVAAPDGLTIVSPLASVITAQAVGDESVKYDASRFNWIGRITDGTRIFFVSSKVKAQTLGDFRSRVVVIGASGRASLTYLNPAFMNKVFGTKFKIVTGYQSAGTINMAVERGETEGSFTTWNDLSSYHPDWLPDGKIRVVLQIGLERLPDIANVPLMLDLAENQADRDLVAFASSDPQMGQSFAAPPGVPPAIVAALRKAFDETMQDPGFIEKMQVAKVQFNPMTGEELARSVARTLAAPRSVIDRYKSAVTED